MGATSLMKLTGAFNPVDGCAKLGRGVNCNRIHASPNVAKTEKANCGRSKRSIFMGLPQAVDDKRVRWLVGAYLVYRHDRWVILHLLYEIGALSSWRAAAGRTIRLICHSLPAIGMRFAHV